MAVFMQVACLDVFEAHAISDTLVSAFRAQGVTLAPVADGSMGGLNHEFMALATLPSIDEKIRELARLAITMAQKAGGRPVELEQSHGSITLTQDEDINRALIREHLRAGHDVRLVVR